MNDKEVTELRYQIAQIEREMSEKKKDLSGLKHRLPEEEVENYTFKAGDESEITLLDMFGDKDELILIHNMGKNCAYCTMWADGFNGIRQHLENRAGFVLISPDDPKTQKEFAESRGWKFKMYSCHENNFAKDMGFQDEEDKYWPGVSAFHKNDDGKILRASYAYFGPGDNYCSTWHLFDLLHNGPADWEPKFS
jgi:predicted dithiol-disulfide oxidoreductase (DUF899 family)